ncbi:kinase-like domain-containing protein [Aspergillus pseudodeflectus]|uniref:Kinase-like domain-containing protein n=1 Tax=Aspergillus pseudodeflectus TaxID=176178 RepID=A0ABR4KHW0_9EURO
MLCSVHCASCTRSPLVLHFRSYRIQQFRNITLSTRQSAQRPTDELFRYTSGRWICHIWLAERYLQFSLPALQKVIATATGRSASDMVSFSKLSEAGFNRLFQATFSDGKNVIARLLYPSTGPNHYAVAREVAALDYLRLHGFTTPKVYGWCSTRGNPVGAEYIIMEKLDGAPLGDMCIYYRNDVLSGEGIPLLNHGGREFCIGPVAHYSWWHEERAALEIDRGPWLSSDDIFRAAGERELKWATAYAKPRLPYERLYREIYNFRRISPDSHIQNLDNYLNLARCLGFQSGRPLERPVMRHPDLQPNNILVSESHEIAGLMDWKHSSILPLGHAAGIPSHFQDYPDPDWEKLLEPQINLPANYDSLDPSEQCSVRQTMRKRLVHFLYAAFTKRLNGEHYHAIFNQSVILHQRLFKTADTPWEGDSITLRAEMIRAIQSWQTLITKDSINNGSGTCTTPPFQYTDTVTQETLQLDAQPKEADVVMEEMRDVLGVDILGWVPNEEYEAAKEKDREVKARMLEVAKTPRDITAAQDHFPFDDFDERL